MSDINATMDKLTGIAALLSPENMNGNRSLSIEASNGICMILEDCARDLGQVGRQYEKQGAAYRKEINELNSRIMELQGGVNHG